MSSDLIWGRNPIEEWLSSDLPIKHIYLGNLSVGMKVETIKALAQRRNISVSSVSSAKLEGLTGTRKHQNIAARVKLPSFASLEMIQQRAERKKEPLLAAVLDGVQDPHNLGAIVRTAEAAGLHGIILPKDRAVGITPTVLKTSAGAAAHIAIAQITNVSRTLKELKDSGAWIIGSTDDASTELYQIDFTDPSIIVLGSEGKGLRRLVRESCDFLVKIPMYGKVSSLNVSVAAGLFFYEAKRQRARST